MEALDVDVPAHVQSRWQQIDEKMRIGELFKSVSRAATALNGFRLKSLSGFKEYSKIKVKQHGDQPGLLQHLKTLGVKGHTTRLKSKGTMFFFLCCVNPENVEFPPFSEGSQTIPQSAVQSL